MKKERLEFWRKVVLTTAVTFTLLAFGYLALYTWASDGGGASFPFGAFAGYTLIKFAFLFAFALSVGFLNRIFDWNKPRPIKRLIHFFGTLFSFMLFVVILMSIVNGTSVDYTGTLFSGATVTPKKILGGMAGFFVIYLMCAGLSALGRKIFLPKEEKEKYKDQF